MERRLQAARKQELAEEQEAENALKMMQSRRHQMQLAEKMRESEEVRVRWSIISTALVGSLCL